MGLGHQDRLCGEDGGGDHLKIKVRRLIFINRLITWVTGSTISVVIALPPSVSRIWLVARLVTVDVTVSVCVSRDVCS